MDKQILTASAVGTWASCKRKYKYQYLDLYRPRGKSIPLLVGSLFHKGLEVFWKGASLEDILTVMDAEIKLGESCETWDEHPKAPQERARTRGMIRAYYEKYDKERANWKDIHVEEEFCLDDDIYFLAGKRDMRALSNMDIMYLWEHKTTSMDISHTSSYWTKLGFDTQLTLYKEAMQRQHIQDVAVIYDVVKKPAFRLKKNQTIDDFEEEIYLGMSASDQYFAQKEIFISPEQHIQNVKELEEKLRRIASYKGDFPRNDRSCSQFNRSCPFLDVCAGRATLDDPDKFQRLDSAHPELEKAIEDANDIAI